MTITIPITEGDYAPIRNQVESAHGLAAEISAKLIQALADSRSNGVATKLSLTRSMVLDLARMFWPSIVVLDKEATEELAHWLHHGATVVDEAEDEPRRTSALNVINGMLMQIGEKPHGYPDTGNLADSLKATTE